MDSSALPYLIYFVFEVIAILAFAVIGHVQRRPLLLFVITWLGIGATRYALIVLSAGQSAMLERDAVVWIIRTLVYFEAVAFAAAAVMFVSENLTWKREGQIRE